MKHFGFVLLVSVSLGGCSSAMDYSSSLGEDQVRRIGRIAPVKTGRIVPVKLTITPVSERQRLIKGLIKARNHHREEALREIEAR